MSDLLFAVDHALLFYSLQIIVIENDSKTCK